MARVIRTFLAELGRPWEGRTQPVRAAPSSAKIRWARPRAHRAGALFLCSPRGVPFPRPPSILRMPQIYGTTTGLGPHATKTLERIYRRKVDLEHIATPELIKSLAEASHEIG